MVFLSFSMIYIYILVRLTVTQDGKKPVGSKGRCSRKHLRLEFSCHNVPFCSVYREFLDALTACTLFLLYFVDIVTVKLRLTSSGHVARRNTKVPERIVLTQVSSGNAEFNLRMMLPCTKMTKIQKSEEQKI